MEKITGLWLVMFYNLANGGLFCFLAGSMITVSAMAVGPLFPSMAMPTFDTLLPTGPGWSFSSVVIHNLAVQQPGRLVHRRQTLDAWWTPPML